ncbi:uncharacterized protein K452DRAFT_172149 [Aplosporella prunicola CBS 121167]|uniref:Potassium channel domain-containing protein n=1 Tax=Aplosporella prunicola CBS 121167 TaxID=1176127 RepID=A0A6A6AXH0_9PEZI|nr:uncharacterized protein K452DRAFT_172149 [Aplosporella prunicola CBS 121167]KAF2135634.1 hypothetical protein K452DRAFT_172149 [Aplosporella prunicola CBS 121167]
MPSNTHLSLPSDDGDTRRHVPSSTVSSSGQHAIRFTEPRRDEAVRREKWWGINLSRRKGYRKREWWFASTAIPLLAATFGPLANVLSISALVTNWRMHLQVNGKIVAEPYGVPFKDPEWCYWINAASLICGFIGNFFLLMNFTQRIRYLISLPATIVLWYIATGMLTAITICMEIYKPPKQPLEVYTQGYWYAVMAATLYFVCSMLLMINMVGFWRGFYPETFTLTEPQRMLIVQTMLFFLWLAGGGAIFSHLETSDGQEGWSFVNALYFCDVTILTVGYGDLVPTNDITRGLVFPYSVGGIIMLGLVISSIYKFATDLGNDKVIKKHINKVRSRTLERTVTSSIELQHRELGVGGPQTNPRLTISGPMNPIKRTIAPRSSSSKEKQTSTGQKRPRLRRVVPLHPIAWPRKPRLLLLREEKDRFDAMRSIQRSTTRFKRHSALMLSICAFGILWAVGAIAFWQAEKETQGMTYFQALYFCYVSLLTIGYGDLAPKSTAGRAFFVVWSLVAVPTMTLLVSALGDTFIAGFSKASNRIADFTVLPQFGIWRSIVDNNPWLQRWLGRKEERRERRERKRKAKEGMPVGPAEEATADESRDIVVDGSLSLETLANERSVEAIFARHLPTTIKRVADDLKSGEPKYYTYEEWVGFTRLIRFTVEGTHEQNEESLVEWDWIGEDSPMMGEDGEAGFVLDRLLESLGRLLRKRDESERAEEVEGE